MTDPYQQFLRTYISPFLRDAGFRQRGSTYWKACGDNLALIGFQKSLGSQASHILFTVNLGIVSGRLGRSPSARPGNAQGMSLSESHWSQRLGQLLPESTDKWWILEPTTDVARLAAEINSALQNLALPALEKYCSDSALRDLWISGVSPGLTNVQRLMYLLVLLNELGPKAILPDVARELRSKSAGTQVSNTVERQLAALGL